MRKIEFTKILVIVVMMFVFAVCYVCVCDDSDNELKSMQFMDMLVTCQIILFWIWSQWVFIKSPKVVLPKSLILYLEQHEKSPPARY
ncbi:MAG: hypothetical protein HQL28_02595 [Candidatus Omnitrophica bacterium]|nr:hypothetical protein [Candidatus Omnitrophota bacterium]